LQLAGLPTSDCEEVVSGDPRSTACSVFLFREGRLVCVESLNRAADHVLARRLLANGVAVTARQLADSNFELKSLLAKSGADVVRPV
jgi:3-phenylpropionate/trans-cinnamate dioxygenase ferredoxin reductase subunit